MTIKHLLAVTVALTAAAALHAQQLHLVGRTVDASDRKAVGYATAVLLRDTVIVAAVAADAEGRFDLGTSEPAGDYELRITAVGYEAAVRGVRLAEPKTDAGEIELRQGVDIADVVVTVQKPLVVADAEKMTYSVEDDPQAATSTLAEIIRKIPQLSLDADGNVLLNGQSDYKVLVNGRTSSMYSRNLKEIIQSMPASQIRRIEVITNPSTKYDAEGAGGIINIVTVRRSDEHGYNGSVGISGQIGGQIIYNPYGMFTAQMGKVTLSVNAGGYSYDMFRSRIGTNRSEQENFDSQEQRYQTKEEEGDYSGSGRFAGLNLSYQPDTLNLVTFEAWYWGGRNRNLLPVRFQAADADGIPTASYLADRRNNYDYDGGSAAVNYEHTFGREGHTLTLSDNIDLSPDRYLNAYAVTEAENYTGGSSLVKEDTRSIENTFQIDYCNPLTERHSIEAGAKYIHRNNLIWQKGVEGVAADELYTAGYTSRSRMHYRQNILSLYAGYSLSLKKISARVGARLEQTWNDAGVDDTARGKYSYGNDFRNLIPYASFTWLPAEGHSLSLSYTNRIRRPSIEQLSPYEDRTGYYSVSSGNPDLRSSVFNTVSFKYAYTANKWSFILSASGFFSDDYIGNGSWTDADGITWSRPSNDVAARTANINPTVSYRPSEKFSLSWSYTGGWYRYRLASPRIVSEGYTHSTNLNANLKLWKMANLSLGGDYSSGYGRLGTRMESNYYYYAKLSQKFLKESLEVGITTYNPFLGYSDYTFRSETGNSRSVTRRSFYRSSFGFSIAYRFGKQNIRVKSTNRSIENDDRSDGGGKGGGQQGQ